MRNFGPRYSKTLEEDYFLNICHTALNNTTPLKQKYARTNNNPFMNTTILIVITKQTRLRNNFLKYRCEANKRTCNAQRNPCLLTEKSKKVIL